MLRTAVTTTTAAALAVLAGASPALAKDVAPAGPAPAVVDCSDLRITSLPDAGTLLVNRAGDAGCIAVRIDAAGTFTVAAAALTPGWTYVAKSGTTGSDRVKLELTDGASRITFLVEPGRTWIR
jgi:hypothetical protein